MNIVAIIVVFIVAELVLGILVGRWLARRSPPPPNHPDSAGYKRGA